MVRADVENLRRTANQDRKRQFNDLGMAAMVWLVNQGRLAENLLLHLSEGERSAILDPGLSGRAQPMLTVSWWQASGGDLPLPTTRSR